MANTIREQLVQAIIARLDPLTPEAEVLRCNNEYDATPGISLWDTTETATQGKFSITQVDMDIVVEYVESVGTQNPSVLANAIIGKIVKSLIGTDPSFGELATSVVYAGSTVDLPDTGGDIMAVRFAFNVSYEFVTGDPYTRP